MQTIAEAQKIPKALQKLIQDEHKYYWRFCKQKPNTIPDLELEIDASLVQEKGKHEKKNTKQSSSASLDDAYAITWQSGAALRIKGSNPRSLVLAIYRFYYELGVRYPRPGKRWELFREDGFGQIDDTRTKEIHIEEAADTRYRGVCIEGANSLENVLDFIEWLPKIGMNTFFMQFFYSYDFFRKWYQHLNNPYFIAENFTLADYLAIDPLIDEAMAQRGILHQRVGHGWTARALGFEAMGWDKVENPNLNKEQEAITAEIDGQRALFYDSPLLTNLCLSNPKAIEKVCEEVVQYAKTKPVDILHLWLADAANCVCTCSQCQETSPADQYIQLLNAVDEALSNENIPT